MGARRTSIRVAALALGALTVSGATAGTVVGAPGPGPDPGVVQSRAERGEWRVEPVGDDQYRVSWTSPARLPMTSDRPEIVGFTDAVAAASTVARDGRTVQTVVTADRRPDAARLDVVLSGDRLDVPGDDRLRAETPAGPSPAPRDLTAPLDLPGTETLPVDPGTPGPYDVTTSDYQLDPIPIHGMKQPIEMIGHVVEPAPGAATGPRPLVLFLHGRHNVCYRPGRPNAYTDRWPCRAPFKEIPSQLGYDYIQQVLASQGYATVSIRANGINAQDFRLDDGGADARAQLVEAHLDHWASIAADHDVDLSRVVLVGHSRGGEGVDRASIQIPLSAPYRIAGQVLIGPTDFATQTAPYVPTVTLLPFCDGDVSDLQGQYFTDSSRDLTGDDTSLKSSVLVMGANHNYFNTEWTPGLSEAPSWDDWYDDDDPQCGTGHPERLTPEQQQAVGLADVAGAVHLFADDEQAVLPLFDGSRARVDSQGTAQTLSHAIGGGRDVRRPGPDAGLSPADGGSTRFCQGEQSASNVASCGYGLRRVAVAPHWRPGYDVSPVRRELEMSWTAAGQSGGLLLADPLDLSDGRLELRTVLDPAVSSADLRVRITDTDGASALLTPLGGGSVPALGRPGWAARYWAQTIAVDPASATGVDLSRIARVDLVARSGHGRLWLLDLSAAPDGLAPVPATRAPTVDLGKATVPEGDGPGLETAGVPFRVHGDLTRPARLTVVTVGEERGDRQRFTVDLAPGQTSGSIPVSYEADTRDDQDQTTYAAAWATRNVMTDAYQGSVTVRDDDPPPTVDVSTKRGRIEEGQPATWRIRLTPAPGYAVGVAGLVVRGPGPAVRVGDIAAPWVARHLGSIDPDTPLWKAHAVLDAAIRAGDPAVTLTLPTRVDGIAEKAESITVRFRVLGRTATKTVWLRSP